MTKYDGKYSIGLRSWQTYTVHDDTRSQHNANKTREEVRANSSTTINLVLSIHNVPLQISNQDICLTW